MTVFPDAATGWMIYDDDEYCNAVSGNFSSVASRISLQPAVEWSSSNVCRLRALAPVVLNALDHESSALNILETFSCNVHFKQDVLTREPMLLETLLQKSLESENGFKKYSRTCVNLLSSPLSAATPAAISPFLTRISDEASRVPCADTLRPIYRVLSGIGSQYLDALPPKTVTRLQGQIKRMLQSLELENHVANLFGLAIMAVMTKAFVATSKPKHDSSLPLEQERLTLDQRIGNYHVSQQYFESKRASKTLDFVVLKVISACSASCTLATTEILETLQLCNTIIEAVDFGDRRSWLVDDRGKFRKLVEKVLSCDQQSEIICPKTVLSICSLLGDRPLPQELMPACKAVFSPLSIREIPQEVGIKMMLFLDESSILDLLVRMLQEASRSFGSVQTLSDLDSALVVAELLMVSVENSASLRQRLLYLLSTKTIAELLRQFLDWAQGVPVDDVGHDHTCFCPHQHTERLTTLQQKISALFLKTAIFSQSNISSLDTYLVSALLDKYMAPKTKIVCSRYLEGSDRRKSALVPIFEVGSTPDAYRSSEQWRDRLRSDLSRHAEYQHQMIIQTMGEACRDLERRCTEVERPLREEQAISRKLRGELEKSKIRVTELETLYHEQSLYLEGLEHEKSVLTDHVGHLETEREDLAEQAERLQQALQEASQEAGDAAENSAHRAKELELVHAAAIAERDEELDAQRQSNMLTRARIEALEKDTATMQQRACINNEEIKRLESTMCAQQAALEQANVVIDTKQTELDGQMELADGLTADKGKLEEKARELSRTCQILEADLKTRDALIQGQREELSNVRREYEVELSAERQNILQLRQSNEDEIEKLQDLLKKQAKDAVQATKESSTRIVHLEHKLSNLTEEIKNREDELEEAKGLTNQVMAFWNRQRRRSPAVEQQFTIAEDSQRKVSNSRLSSPEPAASPLSSKAPPETKRMRTHQRYSSRRSVVGKPRPLTNVETPAAGSKIAPLRQPLQDLDIASFERVNTIATSNEAGTRKSVIVSGKDEDTENSGLGTVEGSFCDSDFFASADQHLVAGMHTGDAQGASDDTTMEF
ncbi:MAG: hypothetical protein Q9219_003067 [cf. Caloplaca sp. 3 TL-2023]